MSRKNLHGLFQLFALIGAAVIAASPAARARDVDPGSLHWHASIGGNFLTGPVTSYLRGGWSAGGGFTWQPQGVRYFAVRADFAYDHFDISKSLTAATEDNTFGPDTGDGGLTEANVDGELKIPFGTGAEGFLIAGVGVAHLGVSLVQPGGIQTYKCDSSPFGVCDRTIQATPLLEGQSSTTAFSWNVGAGIDLYVSPRTALFLETRYVRFNAFAPVEVIPVQIGLRF